ncbi:polyprenyl synthetase family protein [Streptomyces sp. NPDC056149]|uniref:polyprenyl synthetase family protein n=1 Tax=unclassified Streptomyces TaxID=2593676 RepID=UPI00238132ED|nr:polyprenyl synthetase family protein [Streptomyces sp. WZ-12]
MTPTPLMAAPLDLDHIRACVDEVLTAFLGDLERTAPHPQLPELVRALRRFVGAGGKRLRPLLCVVGWHAAGGTGGRGAALRVAASLELLHAAVLIHDDLIDDSATRRGRPTVHRALAARHLTGRGPDALRFGTSAALLLGDLALVWSDHLLRTAHLTDGEYRAVLPVLDAVRRDVLLGQYLDLLSTGTPGDDLDSALAITRYKTAHYTVERPLQAGAALAGAGPELLAACSDFGIPLGEAFQLRDDLLGVFGDPRRTGKSDLDDLREGKHTPLIALTLRRADPHQRSFLRRHLGRPDLRAADAAAVRDIIRATGAHDTVEEMIETRYLQALAALDAADFPPPATTALHTLAEAAVRRSA